MACQENDDGKVEELLESGANPSTKVLLHAAAASLPVLGAASCAVLSAFFCRWCHHMMGKQRRAGLVSATNPPVLSDLPSCS